MIVVCHFLMSLIPRLLHAAVMDFIKQSKEKQTLYHVYFQNPAADCADKYAKIKHNGSECVFSAFSLV